MMRRFAWAGAIAAALWLVWSIAAMPAASVALDAPPRPARARPIVLGAYHVHSTESDGTGTVAQIADAARRAGLDFIIFTDHSDASRPRQAPRYENGVLCIEAVEISTDDGHYAALGIGTAPYPLGGSGREVAEDVRRLGGFGIVAHPDSSKSDLQWKEWEMPVEGFEWFNADSQWRDERRVALLPALLQYGFRGPETVASLFDRPDGALRQWDRLTEHGHVVGLAAADAHARLGFRGKIDPYQDAFYVPLPSYESVFRAFSLQVDLDEPFERKAEPDAGRLLAAIRAGRVTTVFDAIASPAQVFFEGEAAGDRAGPGGDIPRITPITFRVRSNAPPGATTVLIRNGEVVHTSASAEVEWRTRQAGAFRAEIRLPGAPGHPAMPWVVTNPIYVGVPPGPAGQPAALPPAVETIALPRGSWRIEQDESSRGALQVLSPDGAPLLMSFAYRLAPDSEASPFVAAVTHDVGALGGSDRLTFQGAASVPMRLSVQLRSTGLNRDIRWRRSVYLDASPRDITVSFADMRGTGDTKGQAPRMEDVTALLFVVDTVNTRRGSEGAVTLADLRAQR